MSVRIAVQIRKTAASVGMLLLGALLLSGCAWLPGGDDGLSMEFRNYLPKEWTPLDTWQPVNIDDDDISEQLLFYAYERGQVGGVIYDPRTDAEAAPVEGDLQVLVLPNQGAAALVPFRLLPSYWQGKGQGYLADPGAELAVYQVRRPPAEQGIRPNETRMDELIVKGGNTHLSFFWWQNAAQGYGVSHLYAPGGLFDIEWSGTPEQSPIYSVEGYFPEFDRSYFCQRVTYVRGLELGDDKEFGRSLYRPTIGYIPQPQGLAFCKADPEQTSAYPPAPYYPEAVVLAYLLHSRDERQNVNDMQQWVNIARKPGEEPGLESEPSEARSQLVQSVDDVVGEFERVNSLTYYPTLEIASSDQVTRTEQVQMQVIAELVEEWKEGDERSPDTLLAEKGERMRTVNFTLQYQPPIFMPKDAADSRWDRWLIVNAIAGGSPRP